MHVVQLGNEPPVVGVLAPHGGVPYKEELVLAQTGKSRQEEGLLTVLAGFGHVGPVRVEGLADAAVV